MKITKKNKNISKLWIMYGLLAAILGTIQGFAKPNNETKDEKNKRLYTWKIIWGCYISLLFVIIGIQIIYIQ